jgi:7-carboxy-7-deazaguanine synthase
MIIEQSIYSGQQLISVSQDDGIKLSTSNSQPDTLPVMESFYTLQGEGFHQGKAAYFIRLGGCDVGCFWCDVKESWNASIHAQKTIEEIIAEAKANVNLLSTRNSQPIIVITGGEPLLHDLNNLTNKLHKENFKTHIETSGSSPLSGKWDWICLSPKKFKKPLPQVLEKANELKVIIYNKTDFKWAEENAVTVSSNCNLYLQPEWGKSSQVTPLIIDYIKANPQWQLSLQVHKYINIP